MVTVLEQAGVKDWTPECVRVMQAHMSGKTVQIRDDGLSWRDDPVPSWNWEKNDYRIKEEYLPALMVIGTKLKRKRIKRTEY